MTGAGTEQDEAAGEDGTVLERDANEGADAAHEGAVGADEEAVDVEAGAAEDDGADAPARTSWALARGRAAIERLREDRALCFVLVAVLVWCVIMGVNVWHRHDRFSTFDNDLGFHDQYVWLLARGKWFSSVLGLPAFGHNATFGYFLFVPLSWFGLGPHGLNLIQTVAIGLGAVPIYLLAKERLEDGWKAAPLGIVWLLHPVVQGNVWETFHPDAMAMAPLLAAYLCAVRARWRWFAVWVFLALIWKSDVSLFVVMLGALVAVRWNRSVGLKTVAVGVVWFVVCVGWMIPHFSGGGTVFGPLYGDLGNTPTDVARTAITDPGKVAGRAWEHEPVEYASDLLAPFGYVPLLGGAPLVLAVPQAIVNLLSESEFTRYWPDNPHYQALPVTALALALVEGITFLHRRRPGWVRGATSFVLATSFAATAAWGSLWPVSTQLTHYWSPADDPARPSKERVLAMVPERGVVTAHYLFVPHLTHREQVYSFPNPWQKVFYGVESTPLPDPATVQYLAVDTNLLVADQLELWNCIISSGSFQVHHQDDGIVFAERIPGRADDRACSR